MNDPALKEVSKRLSYVLRHRPDLIGLSLEEGGWLHIDDLLAAMTRRGRGMSVATLEQVVVENDKQRFEISADGKRIRARQGHSTPVELGYEPAIPPDMLYHGTATRNLDSILEQGLLKQRRHHVHLSTNKETMIQVAMRHGKPVLLSIHSRRMSEDGHQFFVTGNDVWLVDQVPPAYLAVVEH